MTTLQTLGVQALLGTDKRPPAFPPDDGDIGRLLHALPGGGDNADALRLLRAAGVQAVCGDAGYTPPRTENLVPAPCPEETRQAVDKADVADILRRLFAEGSERPCREALRLMREAGMLLPPTLLPQGWPSDAASPRCARPSPPSWASAGAGSARKIPHGTSSPRTPEANSTRKAGTTAARPSAGPI